MADKRYQAIVEKTKHLRVVEPHFGGPRKAREKAELTFLGRSVPLDVREALGNSPSLISKMVYIEGITHDKYLVGSDGIENQTGWLDGTWNLPLNRIVDYETIEQIKVDEEQFHVPDPRKINFNVEMLITKLESERSA